MDRRSTGQSGPGGQLALLSQEGKAGWRRWHLCSGIFPSSLPPGSDWARSRTCVRLDLKRAFVAYVLNFSEGNGE